VEVAARSAAIAAGDDRRPPPIPGRARVFEDLGLPKEHEVGSPKVAQGIAARRRRTQTLRIAAIKG
jgi:hypothetical protein